jgi:alpha-L-rhamnosidase
MASLPFVQRASWIWSAEQTHSAASPEQASPSHYQVRLFRRTFEVQSSESTTLSVHVSADSRYVFYCNGELIGRGPAKGDVNHHFYDSFDLSAHLRAGRNVLAAIVLDMSRVAHRPAFLGAPCSVMTYAGGFVLEGSLSNQRGEALVDLQTDAKWRVAVDHGFRFQNENTTFEGYQGYFEHRVSALVPDNWTAVEFDDSEWPAATVLFKAELRVNRRDPTSPYGLVPRMIPMLEEGLPEPFPEAFVKGGGEISAGWKALLKTGAPLIFQAGETTELVLDMGMLTTSFPRLVATGGKGSVLRLTYAEALRLPWNTPGAALLGRQQSFANLASHFADESKGWTFDRRGEVTGWCDLWEPSGRPDIFEPLHWRAFRYIGLQITVGAEPLTLHAVQQRFTAYPFKIKASFESSDAELNRIWSVGLHTMRMCSHETFEDCPYYEQMQYAGDTMITSKLAMLTSGDQRLSRQALYQFDWSRLSDGLTQSRFPSRLVQIIPAWSIHWITTLKDYVLCTGDVATLKDLLPGVRAVLDWYRRHTDAAGLPTKLPYWNMTDWCPWWPRGVVPGADEGPTCIHAAQYINALDEASWMLRLGGGKTEAEVLACQAEDLRRKAHALFWSEDEGLYFDRPGGPEMSQYGNAWAIGAGLPGERERGIMVRRFPQDAKLAPGSFFWWHTGFTALAKIGRYDDLRSYLGPWREAIGYGLSTFVEENSYWRSLCHAWSAHPVLEFQQRILGVTPVEPGFSRVALKPHRCGLSYARGSVCTPHGLIEVAWRTEDGSFYLEAFVPAEIRVDVTLPDGARSEVAGGAIKLKAVLA